MEGERKLGKKNKKRGRENKEGRDRIRKQKGEDIRAV